MFEDAHPLEILRWAGEEYGDGLVVTASFGDAVLVHLVSRAIPDADVVLLDTGYLFAETNGTPSTCVRPTGSTCASCTRSRTPPQDLWQTDTDACCAARKVEPMQRALAGKTAWVSGLRRADSPSRATTPIVHDDLLRGVKKINPIATWSDEDVDHYKAIELLPDHPLAERGYTSIGCWPCTRPVQDGRGRPRRALVGSGKSECGLHVSARAVPVGRGRNA